MIYRYSFRSILVIADLDVSRHKNVLDTTKSATTNVERMEYTTSNGARAIERMILNSLKLHFLHFQNFKI
jgi:hypothetical protein